MVSRRSFLSASAAVPIGLALPFSPCFAQSPGALPRMKLEDFVLDPSRLATLKRGVAEMKSRRPSDPTSWFYQGAVHAVTTDAIQGASAQDPDVAKVDQARFWNQCPHSGQNSADFVIWHRAYVYYFEKILRAATGDPTFSLPYWNYTEAGQRTFPEAFADADIDPVSEVPRNPLFDHRREQAFMFGLYELSDPVVSTRTIFGEVNFFGVTEVQGLAGGVADTNVSTRGRLERSIHDLIHIAVGGMIGTGSGNPPTDTVGLMSHVPTAAFDPIFWVHHCNIDRIWTVWECLSNPARSWGHTPDKTWLNAKPWHFNDADGQIQNMPRAFYLDRRNLPIAYDSDDANCTPLSASDLMKKSAGPKNAVGILAGGNSFAFRAEAGAAVAKVRVSPDEAVTTRVPMDTSKAFKNTDVTQVIKSAPKTSARRLVVEIVGLEIEGIPSVGYDVFVNSADAKNEARDSVHYVGTISMFGAGHVHGDKGHAAENAAQIFDITHLALQVGFDSTLVNVTIVPFDLFLPKGDQPRLRRSAGISYSAIRVVVLEGLTSPKQ